jgi:hypothetical protein
MARTAYQEALDLIESGEDPSGSSIPSYMVAGDNLNTANGNSSFLESALDLAESIPKFIGTSIISGANQLYNIPADVGNLFGGDFERSDTGEVIAALDSDLGAFYEEHREGSDLVGFMISSLVPGLGGIKVLNAGQKSLRTAIGAGKFGENTGKALGLLAPQKQVFIDKALKEVATNSSAASLLNRNALKAVGAGIGQNALEALAFEVAITATLFKSPILENQDFGDFVTNVAFGAGVFGFIGGTIDATKISFSLKAAANKATIEARPWVAIAEPATASTSYEKVVLDFEQLNNIPDIPTNLDTTRQAFLKASAATKRTTLENRIRKEMTEISGGDQDVAEVLFQSFKQAALKDQQSAFIGLVETTKFGATAKIATRAEKLQAKVISGKATTAEIDEFAESSIMVAYVKTWGEDAGRVITDKPVVTSLMDTLKKGQVIKVSSTGVKAGAKKFTFDTKFNSGKAKAKPWNILRSDPFESQARYIWASKLKPFAPTVNKPLTVHVNDIPLMEKVMLELGDDPAAMVNVKFAGLDEGEFIGDSIQEFIGARKVIVANKLLNIRGEVAAAEGAKRTLIQDEIAAMVNVKSSFLNGEVVRDAVNNYHLDDILALQSHAEAYTGKLVQQGTRKATDGVVDIWAIPQTVKMTYDTKPFANLNNHVVENMAIIKTQQKLYQEGTSRASAAVLGKDYFKLEDINSGKVFEGAVPSGAGAGFAHAASSNYGTLAASVENIGGVTSRTIEKFKDRARDVLEPLLYKLGNNQEAAIEWSSLNSRVRNIEGMYGLNSAGDALEPLILLRWKKAVQEAAENGTPSPKQPVLSNPAMELRIQLKTPEVRALTKAHIEVNQGRTNGLAGIRTAQGLQFNRAPEAFYPIPVNPKDFPHFAMVVDESVTGGGHSKTLFASSAEELDGMIKKLKQNPQLKILTKNEAEAYHSSRGQWDYEKTLNNNYLDVEAHRKGVSAPFIVATDPKKITSDTLGWHLQRETGLVREAVSAKYEVQFNELRRLGEEFTNVATSKFSDQNLLKFADDAVKNPFADYIKTALGIRKFADYPWWVEPNKMADAAVSKLLKRAQAVVEKSKTPEELAEVNRMLVKGGYKGAAYDETMEIFANAEPARGALSTVVQKANSIMATIVLRLDSLNAVNNAVSANVLLGAETKAVVRAIQRGDAEAVGALAKLTNIAVPGTGKSVMSPTKLIGNAIKKFNRSSEEMKFYKDNGYITSISDQYRGALDSLTFTGKESVKNWDSRVNKLHTSLRDLADKGERWTGNKLAEEFNRFVAADVMKQMTDVAVSRNLMTAKEQLAYINTFVNRTQGNYLAAQRPMMFQGPIGQAIGLFQTYQFNLMQQLLRHVGEGHAKDSMVLLALQGTIHGMNGLPAFNALNTHLVGTASGNTSHRDAYDTVYGIAGKEAGDWLMYGLASNAMGLLHPDLKVNLYTRGDINPRHVTIVPTNPSSIPIIQATGKVLTNLFNTADKLAAGGDITTTLLQGIEHNGLSRPLAGLAQTLNGLDNPLEASYSTSKKGNVIASNDLLSLANLARMVGGKPLDEAVAIDASYRFKAYGLEDAKKRSVLGQAIKTNMIAGADPTQEQVEDFAEKYAAAGGRQEEFNKWFTQLYKTANLSQTNKIQQSLNSPFTQSMQKIMGGRELRDFTED